MLTIPAYDEIEGITVFRDDADPARFHYLPKDIRIAQDANGDPQFTFLRYQFPLNRADSEPGGGYLVFTTNLTAPNDVLEQKVKPRLSQLLRQENPLSTEVPEPTIVPVSYSKGSVELIIMRDNNFVKAIHLGRPSLFADNSASMAVELKADAATLFYEALRQGGSIGAIQYNLSFPVRLPAITILGEIKSSEVKKAVMTYTEQTVTDEDYWGGDTTTENRKRTSIAETMESQGLVKLEILKGTVEVDDEDMESLRAFAFRAMDEFIQKHFLKGGTVETAEDRRSEWMEFLSTDVATNFNLNVSYRDVIDREWYPNAQINPSFLGVPIDDVVLDIDLQNAPWYYNTLNVTVGTSFDFDKYGDIVHSVVGHFSYNEVKPDGTRITARESVVFTKDDHKLKVKAFQTRLADVGRDEYSVEVEVNYKSGPISKQTIDNFDTRVRDLTLEVPNPGVVEIEFSVEATAFGINLKGIEVEIEYGDKRNQVPLMVETILLNAGQTSSNYRRDIFAVMEKPFRYRWTYILDDGDGNIQRSTDDWVTSQAKHIAIPTPYDDNLKVNIIPSVDWNEVKQMVVDLDYFDSDNDYRRRTSLSFDFDTGNKMQPWQVPLRNPESRTYRLREILLFKNNSYEEGDWIETDRMTVVAGNAPGGVVTMEVDPSDVDIGGSVRRVIVSLVYDDVANDVLDTARLLFRDLTPQSWSIARQDAHVGDYRYDVEYIMADGSRRQLRDQTATIQADQDYLFLPRSDDAEPV